MLDGTIRLLSNAAHSIRVACELLVFSGFIFCSIALLLKGDEAIAAARRAARQIRLNLTLYFLDALLVAPVIGILVQLIRMGVDRYNVRLVPLSAWGSTGTFVTFVAVIFIGDFASYWRHRFEHTRLIWPTHAIHHSDTQMTWLTLARFHPFNRLTTAACDITFLAVLGFPDWALVANEMVRHYYGEFIHADLPWMYGPLGKVFVSPVMHRWHHAKDVVGAGSNFATVFSVFDQAFRTHHMPGLCNVPLGVTDEMGHGVVGQLVYPLRAWAEDLGWKRKPSLPTDEITTT